MRFYSSSTPEPDCPAPHSLTAPCPSNAPIVPQQQPVYFYFYNSYYQQFAALSTLLGQELLLNNSLICLREGEKGGAEGGKGDCEVRTTDSNKNASQNQELPDYRRGREKIKMRRRRKASTEEEDSYHPDDEDSRDMVIHVSESKNIPKNYGKAILNFIARNEEYTRKVLLRLGIDPLRFTQSLALARGNLNTIQQLRSLWLQEDNPFAKAYRVFTMEYLRKHCLPYIFNSRVQNFHKHIKYRYKMVESVHDPRSFTHMKEF